MDTSKETVNFDFSLDFLLQETLLLSEKINKEIVEIEDGHGVPSNFEEIIRQVERSESKIKHSVTEITNKLYPDESDQDFLFNLVDEVYEKGISAIYEKENLLRDRNLLDVRSFEQQDKIEFKANDNLPINENIYQEISQISFLDLEKNKVGVDDSYEVRHEASKPNFLNAPNSPGVIFRIDSGKNTFCVRGFSTDNIKFQLDALEFESNKLMLLKANSISDKIYFFETKTYEVAEMIKDQIINRRFPLQEDSVCNISDPGYSWWMDISPGRFEIFFKSHAVNREEKFLKLGPIGDAKIAMIRLNQAHALLRSAFPLSEYSCSEKSFAVSCSKPDHSSFIAFQNIFSRGENNSLPENFPENTIGKTLYCYFLEIATLRKFWIDVESKLS